jgi:hypothetical protein
MHTVIVANSAENGGGIACIDGSFAQIALNEIRENDALEGDQQHGGGIYVRDSSPSIQLNQIEGNHADFGGGIYTSGNAASPYIDSNTVKGNQVASYGGGIRIVGGAPTVLYNVVAMNSASLGGGGVYVGNTTQAQLHHNTIVENDAPLGAGVYFNATPIEFELCIVAFNTGGAGVTCQATNPNLICSVIYGNTGGDNPCGSADDMVYADPQFCGVLTSGDYTLQSDSPCTAANSPCGLTIGARNIGCDQTSTQATSWSQLKSLYR